MSAEPWLDTAMPLMVNAGLATSAVGRRTGMTLTSAMSPFIWRERESGRHFERLDVQSSICTAAISRFWKAEKAVFVNFEVSLECLDRLLPCDKHSSQGRSIIQE